MYIKLLGAKKYPVSQLFLSFHYLPFKFLFLIFYWYYGIPEDPSPKKILHQTNLSVSGANFCALNLIIMRLSYAYWYAITHKNHLQNQVQKSLSFLFLNIFWYYGIPEKIHLLKRSCTKRSSVAVAPTSVHSTLLSWDLNIYANWFAITNKNHLQSCAGIRQ